MLVCILPRLDGIIKINTSESGKIVMSNNIPVKRYITHNCVENCIANLCDFYKIDFRPLFLFSWDFSFKANESILENSIHYHSEFDISNEHFFDAYYDISKSYFNMSFIPVGNDKVDMMSLLIQGNIILIKSDSYYLPWNLAYKKYHIPHSFVAKYDSIMKLTKVTDSFCSNNIIELENLQDIMMEKCLLVKILENRKNRNTSILLKSRYLAVLENNIKNGVYHAISNFSNQIERIDSIGQLTQNLDDLSHSLFIRRLSNITNARYNTKCFFEYLQWSNNFIEAMDYIYTKWESVKNMFLKIFLSQKLKLTLQVKQELFALSNLENDLCCKIIKEM